MRIVFVNWTKPFEYRKKFKGHKKDISNHSSAGKSYNLPEYEILIQKLAFKNAKKYLNLPIVMYTDYEGLDFYQKNDMVKYFDYIDINVLEDLNQTKIDPSVFWTSGKVHAICNEKEPSIFIDLDFIVKENLPASFLEYDLVCPHWEITRRKFHLDTFQTKFMSFKRYNDCLDMLMPNTSFLYIKDYRIKQKYLELHKKIVNKRYKKHPEWLWLIPDQHVLGFAIRDLNSNVTALEDKAFIQYPEDTKFKDTPGFTPRWVWLNKDYKMTMDYYHVWFDKIGLKLNKPYREQQIELWKKELDM